MAAQFDVIIVGGRCAGAPLATFTPPGRMFVWTYLEGARCADHMWLGKLGDHAFLASPTDSGLFMTPN